MNLLDLMIKVGIEDQASGGIDKIVGNAKNAADRIKSGLSTALSVGTKVATVTGTAITAMTGLALTATGELEQNSGGMLQVFKENAAEMETIAKTAYTNMGLSASDFMATANQMGALFQGSGFSIEESATLAAESMQRAADVASIMGIDVSRAMESVAGASKGNFTMMDNLGVAINDTTIAQYALSKGITKTTREMTTQEKVGLAMELFMEKSAYAAGNYARENETLAGSFTTAGAAMRNFLSGAGSAADVITAVTNAARVAVSNIKDIAPRLAEGIGEIAGALVGEIPALMESVLPAVASGVSSVFRSVFEQSDAMIHAASQLISSLGRGIALAAGSIGPAVSSILDSIALYFMESSDEFMSIGAQILGGLGEGIAAGLGSLIVNGADIIYAIVGNLDTALPILKDAGERMAATLKDAIRYGLSTLQEAFENLTGIDLSGIVTMLEPVADGAKRLFDIFQGTAPAVIRAVGDAFGKFAGWFNSTLAPAVGKVADGIMKLLGAFFEEAAASEIIEKIVTALGGLFSQATDSKSTFVGRLADGVVKLLGVFTDGLAPVIKNVADAVVVFGDALREKNPDLFGFADGLESAFGSLSGILENILNIGTEISELILDLAELDGEFDKVFGDIGEVLGAAVYAIADAFDTMIKQVSESFQTLGDLFVNSNFGTLISFVDGTWIEKLNDDINAFGERAWDVVSSVFDGYETARNNDVVSDMYDIRDGIPTASIPTSQSGIGKSTEALANTWLQTYQQTGSAANINLNVDGHTVAQVVYDPLNDIAKQKGTGVPVRG